MESTNTWGYYVNIESDFFRITFWDIGIEDVSVIIGAYLNGQNFFTISGKKYGWDTPKNVTIFHNHRNFSKSEIVDYARSQNMIGMGYEGTSFYPNQVFIDMLISDVTRKYLSNNSFGSAKLPSQNITVIQEKYFINPERIEELKKAKSEYDLSKLIKLCQELNFNFNNGNYYSVGMLGRAILDHIPPLFGFNTFNEVSSEYGTQSFQKSLKHLNLSMKNIASGMLHSVIRKNESLPNDTQVNFSPDFDILLSEIVAILKNDN